MDQGDGDDWENGKVTCVEAPPPVSLALVKLAKGRSAKYKSTTLV